MRVVFVFVDSAVSVKVFPSRDSERVLQRSRVRHPAMDLTSMKSLGRFQFG